MAGRHGSKAIGEVGAIFHPISLLEKNRSTAATGDVPPLVSLLVLTATAVLKDENFSKANDGYRNLWKNRQSKWERTEL
uniref:Uncharacterized protein n=1 Tax=Cucumis sativus TaxID=3659 RepID=A0A0A0LRF6_CUCSA